jgi:hypothetical protein
VTILCRLALALVVVASYPYTLAYFEIHLVSGKATRPSIALQMVKHGLAIMRSLSHELRVFTQRSGMEFHLSHFSSGNRDSDCSTMAEHVSVKALHIAVLRTELVLI